MSAMRSASRGGGNSRTNRSHQDGEEIGSNPNNDEVDMELMDPNKKFIEPDHGSSFKPNPTVVVHTIVKCMKSKYDGAWISWKKVPKNVIDTWFGEFQKSYQWLPRDSYQIKKKFETLGGLSLKNLFNKARKLTSVLIE